MTKKEKTSIKENDSFDEHRSKSQPKMRYEI